MPEGVWSSYCIYNLQTQRTPGGWRWQDGLSCFPYISLFLLGAVLICLLTYLYWCFRCCFNIMFCLHIFIAVISGVMCCILYMRYLAVISITLYQGSFEREWIKNLSLLYPELKFIWGQQLLYDQTEYLICVVSYRNNVV